MEIVYSFAAHGGQLDLANVSCLKTEKVPYMCPHLDYLINMDPDQHLHVPVTKLIIKDRADLEKIRGELHKAIDNELDIWTNILELK